LAARSLPYAVRRIGRAVGVLHLVGGRPCIAKAAVDGDVRLDAEQFAQGHQLVRADVVRLHVAPVVIPLGRPFVGIADGILPVMVGNKIPARKPIHSRIKLFQERGGVCPETLDVVGRHE
jgi:hypothetical protein